MDTQQKVTPEPQQQWTIMSLQNWCTSYLKEKGFENARLNTDLLLSYALKCERIQLYAHFDKPLKKEELEYFRSLFKRRLENEPLQYIIGEAQFMGFSFFVDKRVLVPRPETEILVQETIEILKTIQGRELSVLDIGTGSGNIAISLAHSFSSIQIDAIDISEDALAVAGMNVQRHNVGSKVHLEKSDLFTLSEKCAGKHYDVIVSNPPYISNKEFALLSKDVKDHEPAVALKDGGDGLTFYKTISRLGKNLLSPQGWMLVEIAYDQSYDVKAIFHEEGYSNVSITPDINKIPRVVKAQDGNA